MAIFRLTHISRKRVKERSVLEILKTFIKLMFPNDTSRPSLRSTIDSFKNPFIFVKHKR